MINDYPKGGLKMIDIDSFNRFLKATWIIHRKPGRMEKLF